MKIKYFLFGLIVMTGFDCEQPNQKIEVAHPEYLMVWSDEFDYTGLPDSTKWTYDVGDACDLPAGCGWGNQELQYYTEKSLKNARVKNGNLIIELHKEKIGNSDYSSARLVTRGKADWKYGRFEVRAKLPEGLGVWSAIWMLPSENTYGSWPKSGEIDIMENVGYKPDTITGSAHTLSYNHGIGTDKNGHLYVPDAYEKFHTYTLEWNEDAYHIFVDDKKYFTFENDNVGFKSWPFDQRFYMILNIAYGGKLGGKKGLDPESLPTQMVVDYVRVYQKM